LAARGARHTGRWRVTGGRLDLELDAAYLARAAYPIRVSDG
jgi:hypothetical protein